MIVFECDNCGKALIVRFVEPGKFFRCRACGKNNVVPTTSFLTVENETEEETAAVISEQPKLESIPESETLSIEQSFHKELLQAMKQMAIGLVLYLIYLKFSNGYNLVHSMLAGHIIVLLSLLRLSKLDRFGAWVFAAMILCSIDLLSKIGAIFGLWAYFYIELQFLELVAISAIYYKIAKEVPYLKEEIRLSIITLIFVAVTAVFLLSLIFIPFMHWLVNRLLQFRTLANVIATFGIMFPSLFLTFSSSGLMLFTAFTFYKKLKRINLDSISPSLETEAADQ